MVFIPQYQQQSSTPFAPGGEVAVDGSVGRAVQDLGEQAHKAVTEVIDMNDRHDAQVAQNELLKGYDDLTLGTDGQPGLFGMQGQDAVKRAPEVLRQMQVLKDQQMARLKSGGARRMFGEMADDRYRVATSQVRAHALQADLDDKVQTQTASQNDAIKRWINDFGRDPKGAQVDSLQLVTAIATRAHLEAHGNQDLEEIYKQKYLGDAFKEMVEGRPPNEAAGILTALGVDPSSPNYEPLRQNVSARMLPSVVDAATRAGRPPASLGLPADVAWPEHGLNEMGMPSLDDAVARADTYADAAHLTEGERSALEAVVKHQYVAAYQQRKNEQLFAVKDAGRAIQALAHQPGALSAQVSDKLTGEYRAVYKLMIAQGGPPPWDHPAAGAGLQRQLAFHGDALSAHFPPSLALGLSPASMDKVQALLNAPPGEGGPLSKAAAAARLAVSVANEGLAIARIGRDEPLGDVLLADLGRRVAQHQEQDGQLPTLKEARQWFNEQVVAQTHAENPTGTHDSLTPGDTAADDDPMLVKADWRPSDLLDGGEARSARAMDWLRRQVAEKNSAYLTTSHYGGGGWYTDKYLGSRKWFDSKTWDRDGKDLDKCNWLVADFLMQKGFRDAYRGFRTPWSAQDWQNPALKIPGMIIVRDGAFVPGDIIASSGHVGIFEWGPNHEPGVISANGAHGVRWEPWPWKEPAALKVMTVRRTEADDARLTRHTLGQSLNDGAAPSFRLPTGRVREGNEKPLI